MRKGFSLIEVLVALLICMAIFLTATTVSLLAMRSNRYSESITYASVYGHTKLFSLKNEPASSHDLAIQWHKDPDNPINHDGQLFYRFWDVRSITDGKQVTLYVAWDDHGRTGAVNFDSAASLQASNCAKISFTDVIFSE